MPRPQENSARTALETTVYTSSQPQPAICGCRISVCVGILQHRKCGRQADMRNDSPRFGCATKFTHNHGVRRIARRTSKNSPTYNRTGHSAKATVAGTKILLDRSRSICLHCGGRTGSTAVQQIHNRHSAALHGEQKGQVEAA